MIKIKERLFLNWILVFLWLGVIYFFSNQPNLKSELKPFWDFIFRKIAHLSEFFVLAYLIYRANLSCGFSKNQALLSAFFGVVACSAIDEYHQEYVAGRQASVFDVFIDSLGGLIFCFFEYFFAKINLSKIFLT